MDANDTPRDALPEGQPSEVEGQQPSTPPKTFTEDEVEQRVRERHSTLDKRIAALEKSYQSAEKRAKDAETRLSQFQEESERQELENARDNPDELARVRQRRQEREERLKIQQERDALEQEKAQHQADIESAREAQREVTVWRIAAKHGVDPTTLKDKATRYKLESEEDIDDLAQSLTGGKTPKTKTPKSETSETELNPDSGETSGGGKPTNEQLEAMTPEQYAAWANKRYK